MSLFEDALTFATKAHAGMVRKSEKIPFILHPMEVACIAASMGASEEVLAAALLHDTVEDTPVTIEEIRERFGDRVAELVASETENKRRGIDPASTWKIRKEETLQALANCKDRDIHILWIADKLANMRSFTRLHTKRGNDMWQRFHQNDPAEQAWYYRTVAQITDDLAETEAWKEYCVLCDIVFEGVESPGFIDL